MRAIRKPKKLFSPQLLAVVVLAVVALGYVISHARAAGLVGDLNNDGVVNVFDLSILLSDWGTTTTLADLNNDGTVNIFDLSILISHWGQTGSTPTPTPTATPSPTPTPSGTPLISGVSANGRYLVDQSGNPFLMNGDSDWDLAWKLNAADQNTFLANRQTNGFNTVLTDLVGSPGVLMGNTNGTNYAGDLPFTGSNFTPNPTYWAKIDTFFQAAAQHGISVLAIPIDAYATQNVFSSMTDAQAQAFGTFLAQRYPQTTYPGIVWMMGNDYGGDGVGCCGGGFNTQYQSLLTGLKNGGSTRPTTIEQGFYESLSSDGPGLGPLVSVNAEYSYHPIYAGALRGYAKNAGPVFFIEGAYENATTGFPSAPLDLRKQVGWAMTSGETGTFYGNDSLWFFDSSWQSLLNTAIVNQRKAFFAAIAGTKWWTLAPDTGSQLVTGGRGIQGTSFAVGSTSPNTADGSTGHYVTASLSADGSLGLIYNPDTSVNHITVSNSMLGASPTITAIDPTNGARTDLGWTTAPTMGANAGGDHDWLFVVSAAAR